MKKNGAKNRIIRLVKNLLALLVVAAILFPIIWMLPAAFKDRTELFAIPNQFLPAEWSFDNFEKVFTMTLNGYNFTSSLLATFVVAVIATALSLIINMMAGYVFARIEFPMKNVIWWAVLVTMFIPGITILLTSIRVVNILHMVDTLWVLIIPGVVSAYNIFYFRQFFLSIPKSLEDAALLEAEPEREELQSEYVVGSNVAINITIPNGAENITVAEKAGYVLEAGLDYTYEAGVLTLKNEYADGLASGKNDLIITAGDVEYKLRLIIRQPKPALPESSDGYLMQETLVGGDFEMFEEGFAFSLEQVEGWGSNISYDDPGVIVNQNGNKVLRLQKAQKSSYSSAFAFISPTIQAGDVLTFKFDYKLDVQDISLYQGADINLSFVSASNMQMLKIALDNSCPAETTGDGDYQWAVNYTTLEDGWIRVEMTFVANTALLSYNSMRFLLPTDKAMEGDAMYVDNVSLVLWAQPEAPENLSSGLGFNKGKPADVFAMVDLQALDPKSITCDGTAVDTKYWSINPAKDTITFSKDFLATLANGDHTFTVTTAGGSCDLTITVSGEAAAGNTDNTPGTNEPAPSNGWIWIVVAAVVVDAVVVVVIIRKKNS